MDYIFDFSDYLNTVDQLCQLTKQEQINKKRRKLSSKNEKVTNKFG